MNITPGKLNQFLMFKLPSAWLCGVRVKQLDENNCHTTVTYRWINQNPFNSMFWAVQGMAAELATGALVMGKIKNSGKRISMLVANNKANFSKKATGKISFICSEGAKINEAIANTIATGEGQTFWMEAKGTNSKGEVVSTFSFEWTVKVKN